MDVYLGDGILRASGIDMLVLCVPICSPAGCVCVFDFMSRCVVPVHDVIRAARQEISVITITRTPVRRSIRRAAVIYRFIYYYYCWRLSNERNEHM